MDSPTKDCSRSPDDKKHSKPTVSEYFSNAIFFVLVAAKAGKKAKSPEPSTVL